MTLLALIKKGGLTKAVTATPATIATQEANQTVTVASVATVAVAKKPEPHFEAVKHPALPQLSTDEESSLKAWLAYIEETDQDIITETINRCQTDSKTRQYFLQLAKAISHTVNSNHWVTCGNCTHFERIAHPNLGHCTKGEPEAIAGLWDNDRRWCQNYLL
jgi:carboxypeptidase C (cathepsin A)